MSGSSVLLMRTMLGLGLILMALWAFLSGTSPSLGAAVRSLLRPTLTRVRSHTERTRSELADVSMIVAVVLAAASIAIDRNPLGAIVAVILWMSRPQLQRLTKEEHPLLALPSEFSADLVVGLYAPVTLGMILMGELALGASMAAVIVALCWPPGEAGSRVRQWRLNWARN